VTEDEQHLNLLGIFHCIVGGMTALFACFPVVHLALGVAMLTGALDGKDAPPPFMGWMFIIFPVLFILGGWALAACMIVAGRKLQKHTSRMFCLVVAGVECIMMPFGTVLGVFTIIVLMRESVRKLFDTGGEVQAVS